MTKTFLTVGTLMVLLSACVSIEAVGPGSYAPNNAYSVTLGKVWTAYPPHTRTKTRSLTIDGVLLNNLTFAASIKDGESIVATAVGDREKLVPKFRSDMGDFEIAEFFTDSLTVLGMTNLETTNMRPDKFGSLDGIRFEFTGSASSGLNYAGMAKSAVQDGTLHLMFFYAPEEYYYGLHEDEVEKAFDSVALSPGS